MQAEMSIPWWPALVFGWPGPILAVTFCVVGIVRAKVAWLIAAAVVITPLSLYLGMNPRVQWGIALPLFPLIAAGATSRGSKTIAWLSLLLLTGMILWLASIVFGERVTSRLSIAHVLNRAPRPTRHHAATPSTNVSGAPTRARPAGHASFRIRGFPPFPLCRCVAAGHNRRVASPGNGPLTDTHDSWTITH